MIWVKQAKQEHDAFVEVMRDRGVEVFYAEELLTDVLGIPEARDWIIGQVLDEKHVGLRLARSRREWAQTRRPREVADYLIGGMTKEDLEGGAGLKYDASVAGELLVPPLPNFIFRDPSSWIFDGVTLNPMAKPAAAGDGVHGGDLPPPSDVRRRGVQDLARGRRDRLGAGHGRGRRRHAARQGHRDDRDGRATSPQAVG